MAFDFPNSPVENQEYTPPGGPSYVYRSPRWLATAGPGAILDASANVIWQTVAAAAGAFLPSSAKMIRTQSFGTAVTEGGATYTRTSKAFITLVGSVYPASSYFQSQDRFMPDGSTDNTNGGYWLLDETSVTPYMFGGIGDGVADDAGEINDACLYLFLRQRGGNVRMDGGRWLVDSANIQLRTGVTLLGTWNNAGNDEFEASPGPPMPPMMFSQWKSCIVINPAYTIQLAPYDSCGLKGLVLLRKGLTRPMNLRESIDGRNAFAGTAVSVGTLSLVGGSTARDTYFGYCFVVGFEYAYWAYNCDRMHIEYINGDCTNGIYISRCYDTQHLSHCHFWPYYSSNAGGPADYPVTLAANNGAGLIRLTIGYVVTGTLSNTNPAKITVSPADIGKFAYGNYVKITGIDDPVMAAALGAGVYFIYDVNTVTPNTFTINVNCSGGAAPETVNITTNILVTGDTVSVDAVGGVPAATGKWVATVVDPTHIDLQGSTFTGAYTSGGHVYLAARIRGTCFKFDYRVDGAQAFDCFNYGWDIGWEINECAHALLINCMSDNSSYLDKDMTTIGVKLTNSYAPALVGCRMSGMGIGYYVDVGASVEAMLTQCESHGAIVSGVHVQTGKAVMTGGCLLQALPVGIHIEPTSDGIYCIGNRAAAVTTIIDAPEGRGKRNSFVQANDWADAGQIGNQLVYGNTNILYKYDYYADTNFCVTLTGRKSRGSTTTPTQATSSDSGIAIRAELMDDIGTFRQVAAYRMQGNGAPTSLSSPGKHVWSITPAGAIAPVDRLVMEETALYALPTQSMALGGVGARWTDVVTNKLTLPNNVSNPPTVTNHCTVYLDGTALKVKFPSGTIKTLATDP